MLHTRQINEHSDLKQVLFRISGAIFILMASGLIPPMILSIFDHDKDFFTYVIIVAGFSVASLLLFRYSRHYQHFSLKPRHVFLLTVSSWLMCCLCACLPFLYCNPHLSLIDSWFESVSAITTTGSTVITGLDFLPRSILLWRAELQWFGGVGIVVMAMAIFPFLRIGGMKLFQSESSDISEKFSPRISHLVNMISLVYLLMTLLFIGSYHLGGMNWFDAITHAMTTAATGGFSNYDASFSTFNDRPVLLWMASIFMFIAGMPFVLFIRAMRGQVRPLLTDPQTRWYGAMVLISIILLTLYRQVHTPLADNSLSVWFSHLTHVTFNIISVISTTGYASQDYTLWGGFSLMLFFYLTLSGGCSGSTSGGIKAFRQQLGAMMVLRQMKKLIHPRSVIIQRYQGKRIDDSLLNSIIAFTVLYFAIIAVISLLLAFSGMDFVTAISGSMTAVSNVGPGLSAQIGPSGNFQDLSFMAKFWLSCGMLLGRLEILSIVIMFSPAYWKA